MVVVVMIMVVMLLVVMLGVVVVVIVAMLVVVVVVVVIMVAVVVRQNIGILLLNLAMSHNNMRRGSHADPKGTGPRGWVKVNGPFKTQYLPSQVQMAEKCLTSITPTTYTSHSFYLLQKKYLVF